MEEARTIGFTESAYFCIAMLFANLAIRIAVATV